MDPAGLTFSSKAAVRLDNTSAEARLRQVLSLTASGTENKENTYEQNNHESRGVAGGESRRVKWSDDLELQPTHEPRRKQHKSVSSILRKNLKKGLKMGKQKGDATGSEYHFLPETKRARETTVDDEGSFSSSSLQEILGEPPRNNSDPPVQSEKTNIFEKLDEKHKSQKQTDTGANPPSSPTSHAVNSLSAVSRSPIPKFLRKTPPSYAQLEESFSGGVSQDLETSSESSSLNLEQFGVETFQKKKTLARVDTTNDIKLSDEWNLRVSPAESHSDESHRATLLKNRPRTSNMIYEADSPSSVSPLQATRGTPMFKTQKRHGVKSKMKSPFKQLGRRDCYNDLNALPMSEGTEVTWEDKKRQARIRMEKDEDAKQPSLKKSEMDSRRSSFLSSSGSESSLQSIDDRKTAKTRSSSDDDSNTEGYHSSKWDKFDESSDFTDNQDKSNLLQPWKLSQRTRRSVEIFAILVFTLCGVGLALFYTRDYWLPKKDTADASADIGGVTYTCETMPMGHNEFSQRYVAARNIIQTEQDFPFVDDPGSVQRNATCWLAETDERQLPLLPETKKLIVQRYTVALVFFSLSQTSTEDDLVAEVRDSNIFGKEHECQWDFIVCNNEYEVTGLLLADKNLVGEIPSEVANLSQLTFVDLSLNTLLGGTLPSNIGLLKHMEYLGVSFSKLSGPLPTEIGLLEKMEYLNLRSTQVIGAIPTELGLLQGLQGLLLDNSWLSGTIPSELGKLKNSEIMTFQKTYLSGFVPDEVCQLHASGKLSEVRVDSSVECSCCV